MNQTMRLPGESFLPEGTRHLTREKYRQAFENLRDEVFAYPHWNNLLRELGLAPLPKSPDDLNAEGRAYNEIARRRAGGVGEDEGHLGLKRYVAQHPEAIGLSGVAPGRMAYEFVSDDRCDVVFRLAPDSAAIVEVKNGERGELVKGLYQAIKYRALLAAEQGKGAPFPVKAYLVAYSFPEDIADFASRFEVECYAIDRTVVGVTA